MRWPCIKWRGAYYVNGQGGSHWAPDGWIRALVTHMSYDFENWTHAAAFLEDIVASNPQDFDSTYDLAKISYLSGNVARAKELVAQLRIDKPGLVETDPAFMQALGQQ